ncbi:MAG: diguanylate cyclase domain-containing protein [Gammaproteobacteria bacterium]
MAKILVVVYQCLIKGVRNVGVNDLFGHKVGDKLLQAVAGRLIANIRDSDTVSRLGGDEFLMLLENMSDREMLGLLVQKIVAVLSVPYRIDGHAIDIGVSVGASLYPEDGRDAKALIHRADIAMYGMKNDHGKFSDVHSL